MSSSKKIVLTSSDGETFYVDEAVAVRSQTIKRMIEVDCADSAIPLPNVTSSILAKVIQYCEKHVEIDDKDSAAVDDALKVWDAEFVKVEQHVLYALIMAANYLDIQSLVDFTCQTVADMLKGKTTEEMREILNINNDPDPRGGGALGSRLGTLFMSSFFWMFLMLVVILGALK